MSSPIPRGTLKHSPEDCGDDAPPFIWDPERRFRLRCDIDAAFFHLYGISRDDTTYILDTFPVLERAERRAHGEYRTKRVVLEIYDALASSAESGLPYESPLGSPRRGEMSGFRFREIHADNYRCFEELKLSLEQDTTVLFAENGGGKTALLTALAMGLTAFQRGAPRTLKLDVRRDPTMRTLDEKGRREPVGPCKLAWTAAVGESDSVPWSTAAHPASGRTTNQSKAILEALDQVRVPGDRWPLFAWYGVDRLARTRGRRRKVERMGDPLGSLRLRARPEPRRGPAASVAPGRDARRCSPEAAGSIGTLFR